MTEIKHEFFDFSKEPDNEWIRVVRNCYQKSKEAKEALEAQGITTYEEEEEYSLSANDRLECLKDWGVPARILNNLTDLEQLINTKAKIAVENYLKQPQEAWCLVLSGGKGTGKSTAAALWLYENVPLNANETSYKKRYWWSGTKIARINGYNKDYEKMIEAQYMVIDDLGIEYLDKNGNFLQRLDELIDERYSNFRRTIITTNLNGAAFKERYGDRVSDRMRESFSAGGQYLEIPDESLRTARED